VDLLLAGLATAKPGLPGDVGHRAEGNAEHAGEHDRGGMVGFSCGESGGLIDGEQVIVVARPLGAVHRVGTHHRNEPRVPDDHREDVRGNGGGGGPPVDRGRAGVDPTTRNRQ
jgi:hypothetical protein